jgi:hypothetical protein
MTLDEAERDFEAAFEEMMEALDSPLEYEAAAVAAAVAARFVIESAALPGPTSREPAKSRVPAQKKPRQLAGWPLPSARGGHPRSRGRGSSNSCTSPSSFNTQSQLPGSSAGCPCRSSPDVNDRREPGFSSVPVPSG